MWWLIKNCAAEDKTVPQRTQTIKETYKQSGFDSYSKKNMFILPENGITNEIMSNFSTFLWKKLG